MTESLIPYPTLLKEALVSLVRTVLLSTAEDGLPGDHHFFITFDTAHEGVELADSLRKAYPEELTIVLQHQYWDLEVEEEEFAVTLRFGGTPYRMRVPFDALKSFADPEASFGLQFEGAESDDVAADAAESTDTTDTPDEEVPRTGKVLSTDRFRRQTD